MAKKKNNIDLGKIDINTIILGVILILFIAGLKQGWFFQQSTFITNNTIINRLDNPQNPPGLDCFITFDKTTVEIGDEVVGTIHDGKNTDCWLYYNYENAGWVFDSVITTNNIGLYSETRSPGVSVGTFYWAAICNECTTDRTRLIVKNADDDTTPPPADECFDTDGGDDIWVYGICNPVEGPSQNDVCPMGNFEDYISEAYCGDGVCLGYSTSCNDLRASCYEGRCIRWDQDSDNDGWSDLDEYEQGTDPIDPEDYHGAGEDGATTCNQYCTLMNPDDYTTGACAVLILNGVCPDNNGYAGDWINSYPADSYCWSALGPQYNCCCYPTIYPN